MTPVSYTEKDGVTTFHYKYGDLKRFIKNGKNGSIGIILTKRDGKFDTYRGYLGGVHKEIMSIHNKRGFLLDRHLTNNEIVSSSPPKVFRDFSWFVPKGKP